jgi:hypothetical protein
MFYILNNLTNFVYYIKHYEKPARIIAESAEGTE